jgi:RimJ/RimL family protein N-acetyltransferase
MLDYVFGVLGLNRVWAGVLEDNPASLRILEKCDFKMEGRLRKHAFKEGKFKDVFILAFCASDWQPPEESSRAAGRQ